MNIGRDSYTIRRFQPDDAAGVTALVRRVWGDGYPRRELYDPCVLARLNAEGRTLSVVGLDPAGAVVAHDALIRPDLGPVAETGAAMVAPEHRGHGLMTRTRHYVLQLATELDLAGVFGHPITDHVISQKVYVETGFTCTGLLLGWRPASFHEGGALAGRGSVLLYFKSLRCGTPRPIYPPPEHADLIQGLYQALDIPVSMNPAPGPLDVNRGAAPLFYRTWIDTEKDLLCVDQVAAGCEADAVWNGLVATIAGHGVVQLQIPVDIEQAPTLCAHAAAAGFFFAGLWPRAEQGRDMLLYFRVRVPLAPGVQYADARADTLVRQVAAGCARANGQQVTALRPCGP